MSDGGEMIGAGRRPPGVTSMVGYRSMPAPGVVHRGLPSSKLVFIVSRDEGVVVDGLPANPVVLAGMHTAASAIVTPTAQAGVQLAVHPLAARALFGRPAAEIDVSTFGGVEQLGRRAVRLHERLTETRSWSSAFGAIEDDLLAAWDEDMIPRPELVQAWRLLENGASVAGTARAVGYSERRLQALFRAEFGCSPRTIAQLMRFERVTDLIARWVAAGSVGFLADVAVTAGYSDQAHLTREFRRFAGVTPGAWIVEEFANIQAGGHRRDGPSNHDDNDY
ncbi:MAG: AraC family transcriptional regulator [Nocardia sp.]|nr:AraC family transcriptional regulator [Nocardia sp.]